VLAPSNYEDFSAAPYGDKLLFVSSRETNLFSKRDRGNNQRYFDLYLYDMKSGEVSRYGDQLSSLEKSKFHLGPATLLPDSAGVILSRNYRVPNLKDEVNFYLVYENWKTGEKYTLPFCSMANSFQHPFYDAKRRRLYFTSNMPGGPGGYDIYFSELLKDNSWGDPVLVEGVNGPRDDVFPTISKDGTLYFSRTESQMGLNLFSFENGEVAEFNAPLTTSRDEFSIIEIGRDSAVFSQSQKGRFNTDLVLAWIDSGSDASSSIASTSSASDKDNQYQSGESQQDLSSNGSQGADIAQTNEDESSRGSMASSDAQNQTANNDPQSYAVAIPFSGSANAKIKELREKGSDFSGATDVVEIDGQWYLILSPFTADEKELVAFESSCASQNLQPARIKKSQTTSVANQELNKKWYSLVASSHVDFEEAVEQLSLISGESDKAYISLYEGRYYVVLNYNTDNQSAVEELKKAEENGWNTAFLMTELLAPIRMPNLMGSPDLVVYFEFDKTYVQEKYRAQIDKVIANLPTGRDKVYLVGHTDSRGPNEYNVSLGMGRAKSVAEYIGNHHESLETSEDLHSKGEFELTNKCEDGVECDEYAHFLNRRVEIWFY
jgi:outer membrane protein OmpA-like peptidoglycan-associated protein